MEKLWSTWIHDTHFQHLHIKSPSLNVKSVEKNLCSFSLQQLKENWDILFQSKLWNKKGLKRRCNDWGTLKPHWVSFTVFTAKIQTQAWKPILDNIIRLPSVQSKTAFFLRNGEAGMTSDGIQCARYADSMSLFASKNSLNIPDWDWTQ